MFTTIGMNLTCNSIGRFCSRRSRDFFKIAVSRKSNKIFGVHLGVSKNSNSDKDSNSIIGNNSSGDAKFQSTENDEYKQNSKSVNDSDNSDLEQNPDSITANGDGSIELGDSVYNELDIPKEEIIKTILKKIKNRDVNAEKELTEFGITM
ncbi:hypothetical protein C2G38_2227154 [Gigaspora rosea]|uniref:Uncharacterized protein n=1 Tax=Gigaspora rosea TaxID=44941 RepID=A0A397TXP7_9GLOM|nr:hypothetical protein C2G38_2227154 [Gigaspora rosea]